MPGSDFSVVPYDGDNEDTVLSHLDGTCLTLARGWWSFEWCHKQRIRQFHVNPDHTVGPDWSLGEYVKIHVSCTASASYMRLTLRSRTMSRERPPSIICRLSEWYHLRRGITHRTTSVGDNTATRRTRGAPRRFSSIAALMITRLRRCPFEM